MWRWSCPNNPGLIWEHHSLESANQSILLHLLGSEQFNFAPCPADPKLHQADDDLLPCSQPELTGYPCRIPYIQKKVEVGPYGRIVV